MLVPRPAADGETETVGRWVWWILTRGEQALHAATCSISGFAQSPLPPIADLEGKLANSSQEMEKAKAQRVLALVVPKL